MASKKVAILQSSYIPWKGYFDLIHLVDEFILYDDVQYRLDKARNIDHTKDNIGPTNEFVRFIDRIRPSDSVESVARMNYMIEEFDDLYFIDRNKRRP